MCSSDLVAALPLRIDGVESQTALARARQTGESDELVARNLKADVLQIVLARPLYRNDVVRTLARRRGLRRFGSRSHGQTLPSAQRASRSSRRSSLISSRSRAAYSKRRSAAAVCISSSSVCTSRPSSFSGSDFNSATTLRRSRSRRSPFSCPEADSLGLRTPRMSPTALRMVCGSMPCSAL